jgi:rhomboid family GlyGly-CTERM serine protease
MSDGLPGLAPSISRLTRQWMSGWWLLGLLIAALVLLSLLCESGGGEHFRQLLRYQREAVLQGEYWRLLTGHLVHGSWLHLFLNCAGLGLLVALYPAHYSPRQWLFIGLLSLITIDIGFVFWEPQLSWYVGLSGVLHGALAAGGIAWWRYESKRLALALSVIFVGKLIWEQWHGALPLSGGMAVVVDAHLYGALGGVIAGTILWMNTRAQVADTTQP